MQKALISFILTLKRPYLVLVYLFKIWSSVHSNCALIDMDNWPRLRKLHQPCSYCTYVHLLRVIFCIKTRYFNFRCIFFVTNFYKQLGPNRRSVAPLSKFLQMFSTALLLYTVLVIEWSPGPYSARSLSFVGHSFILWAANLRIIAKSCLPL